MRELRNDPFYNLIQNYPRCGLDYCLMEDDAPHQGERSHKDAVLFAMRKVFERDIGTQAEGEFMDCKEAPDGPFPWNLDIGKAQAHRIDPETLLHVPGILRTERYGRRVYDCGLPDPAEDGRIPYWYAFWETPHPSGYGPEEFRRVNSVLFPGGTDGLEVYEWTTDWSDYFDDGHEWWGAACWSIYDQRMNRYAVILASATD